MIRQWSIRGQTSRKELRRFFYRGLYRQGASFDEATEETWKFQNKDGSMKHFGISVYGVVIGPFPDWLCYRHKLGRLVRVRYTKEGKIRKVPERKAQAHGLTSSMCGAGV